MFASTSSSPAGRHKPGDGFDVAPKHACDQACVSPVSKASNASSSGNLVLLWQQHQQQRASVSAHDQVRARQS